jgi:hypothetical protein
MTRGPALGPPAGCYNNDRGRPVATENVKSESEDMGSHRTILDYEGTECQRIADRLLASFKQYGDHLRWRPTRQWNQGLVLAQDPPGQYQVELDWDWTPGAPSMRVVFSPKANLLPWHELEGVELRPPEEHGFRAAVEGGFRWIDAATSRPYTSDEVVEFVLTLLRTDIATSV